jgi:glycosyltransferase involved in cell wall biosynthesis
MVDDCAYVGYELRRELGNRGLEVQHLFFSGPKKIATLKMAFRLRRIKCDLIHAHFCRSAAYASYASGKPYIVHCHGSDVRSGINWLKRRCLKKANKVLVSTSDLLEILPDATWLPNPVDTERFKPLKEHGGNRVLYFPRWYEDLTQRLKETCKRFSYSLTAPKFYSVPYEEFHLFLNGFDIFVDQLSIKSYSKTALEAMACGLPVIGYQHDLEEVLEKLNSQDEREKLVKWQNEHVISLHESGHVVDKLIRIYEKLL